MQTIWKHIFGCPGDHIVQLPKGAQILSAHSQNGNVCMWFLHDDNVKERMERHFHIAGTGFMVPTNVQATNFIGTVTLMDTKLIFHVFEVTP